MRGVSALVLLALAACGARTGLNVPELDAAVEEEEEDPQLCIELPLDGSGVIVDLATDAELKRADVFLLLDNSNSMEGELDAIRTQLRREIAPLVFETIPDTEFGVATFSDFPQPPYGESGDRPFDLALTMTADLAAVQSALDLVRLRDGADIPESQIEALYQIATGDGLGDYIAPSRGCPSGGFGAPCFRDDAQPVVLLFTDAPMHNAPTTRGRDYDRLFPQPHSYDDALDVLLDRKIHVIGLWSGGADDIDDLTAVVKDTGGLEADGEPLVFNIGEDGQRLGSGVVETLAQYAEAAIFDVEIALADPDPGDGVDVLGFVGDVRPARAEPADGIAGVDEERDMFLGVRAGTTVIYEITLQNDAFVPAGEPRVFPLSVAFRGNGTVFLGSEEVLLVVPSITGEGCDALDVAALAQNVRQ